MALCITVVRGPDWKWGNEDSGEGHTGTVVRTIWRETKIGLTTYPPGTVIVKWNNGFTNVCRAGAEKAFDLRILDHSYRYMKHVAVKCDCCSVRNFKGIRWKCANCPDYDLCSKCYMSDMHNGSHSFWCIVSPGSVRVKVPERSISRRVRIKQSDSAVSLLQLFARATFGEEDRFYYPEHLPVCTAVLLSTIIHDSDNYGPCSFAESRESGNGISVQERCLHTSALHVPELYGNTQRLSQDRKIDTDARSRKSHPTLQFAAEIGDLEAVKTFLESSADVNSSNSQVHPALHMAVFGGDIEIVKLLLEYGCDVNIQDNRGNTALHVAAFKNNLEIVNLLLDAPDVDVNQKNNTGLTVLHCAVVQTFDSVPIIEAILKNKADVNSVTAQGQTALHLAVLRNKPAVVKLVKLLLEHNCDVNIQDSMGATALYAAMRSNNFQIIDLLLKVPDIDLSPKHDDVKANVLHVAAFEGNNFAVERIIARSQPIVNEKTHNGFTALHIASKHGHFNVAKTLIAKGQCEINACNDHKHTPLFLAALQGNCSLVELLISVGADIDVEDESGNTCLHAALMKQQGEQEMDISDAPSIARIVSQIEASADASWICNLAISCYLIQKGAVLSHYNHEGKTPLDLVSSPAVKDMLQQFARKKIESEAPGAECSTDGNTQETNVEPTECMICSEVVEAVTFEPCGHKVACEDCCFKMKKCISCQEVITRKIAPGGYEISPEGPGKIIKQMKNLEHTIQEMQEAQRCAICMDELRNVAFSCGHGACLACSRYLWVCHLCRKPINTKIKLYK